MNKLTRALNRTDSILKGILGVENIDNMFPSSYRNGISSNSFGGFSDLQIQVSPDIYYSFNNLSDVITAYEKCPPVFSIINRQAYAFSNGKIQLISTALKDAGSPVKSKWSDSVWARLDCPNPLQNWRQFLSQVAVYIRTFSYCVIVSQKPTGYKHYEAEAWWVIPPSICEPIFASGKIYEGGLDIDKMKIKGKDGTYSTLLKDQFFVLRDIVPGFEHTILPGSAIKPLKQNINNLIGIYESKGMLINYRGALGILSPEIDPNGAIVMDNNEKELMESRLAGYGLRRGQSKFIISNAAVNWQQIGVPYRDLMFTEWAEDDIMAICDGLVYPFKLLSNSSSSSMNGTEVDSFIKMFYQDFVLPFSQMVMEQLEVIIDAKKNNAEIKYSFDHIEVLQQDKLKTAQARVQRNIAFQTEFYNNLMTLNEWNKKNGEPPIPDTVKIGDNYIGDKYFFQLKEFGISFGKESPIKNNADETK